MVFEMTNSYKSVFTSHIKHGWQGKRMIMENNACVSCALSGHNFPTVLQAIMSSWEYFKLLRTHLVTTRKLTIYMVEIGVDNIIVCMFRHLYSQIAHFMRYHPRKWKHLVGWHTAILF